MGEWKVREVHVRRVRLTISEAESGHIGEDISVGEHRTFRESSGTGGVGESEAEIEVDIFGEGELLLFSLLEELSPGDDLEVSFLGLLVLFVLDGVEGDEVLQVEEVLALEDLFHTFAGAEDVSEVGVSDDVGDGGEAEGVVEWDHGSSVEGVGDIEDHPLFSVFGEDPCHGEVEVFVLIDVGSEFEVSDTGADPFRDLENLRVSFIDNLFS